MASSGLLCLHLLNFFVYRNEVVCSRLAYKPEALARGHIKYDLKKIISPWDASRASQLPHFPKAFVAFKATKKGCTFFGSFEAFLRKTPWLAIQILQIRKS